MSDNRSEVMRRLSQLYARIDGPTEDELDVWLEYLQRRFNVDTSEIDALWQRASRLGEWADRKVRDVTRVRTISRG
jgi:hypothetical protein